MEAEGGPVRERQPGQAAHASGHRAREQANAEWEREEAEAEGAALGEEEEAEAEAEGAALGEEVEAEEATQRGLVTLGSQSPFRSLCGRRSERSEEEVRTIGGLCPLPEPSSLLATAALARSARTRERSASIASRMASASVTQKSPSK